MLLWVGRMFARLVGLSFALVGAWLLLVNLLELSYSGGTLVWILVSGAAGLSGGILYLVSFDGPVRFRTPRVRFAGWLGMFGLALLPSSLSLILVPMVLLAIPSLGLVKPRHLKSLS
jgi:hypothetical protein